MSQKTKVLKLMREQGYVTRNWALSNFISRLSAIILDLKQDGVNIEGGWKEGDFVYKLLDKPVRTEVFRVNGEIVAQKIIW
jgi:hypothetical protein